MAAPAFQLTAQPVAQLATPGTGYQRGNRPDPNNSNAGAEIRSREGRIANVGDWVDYLTANIYFALQDEDLRYDLIARLRELIPPSR